MKKTIKDDYALIDDFNTFIPPILTLMWVKCKLIHDLRSFLLSREFDIATAQENFGELKDVFLLVFGRKPITKGKRENKNEEKRKKTCL